MTRVTGRLLWARTISLHHTWKAGLVFALDGVCRPTHIAGMATVIDGSSEWDSDKAVANFVKHGVRFIEAATVLADPVAVEYADLVYPERLITIGMSINIRVLYVVSTERHERIRIISARKANSYERNIYETQ